MNDHPYAVGNTLAPGEKAEDDPFSEEEWCPECDESVDTSFGECPLCGKELT
jgi:hypothetical protein